MPVMHVLHVLSNWKWTERAEPAVDLALAQRRLGATVSFACGRNRGAEEDCVAYRARGKGLEPIVLDLTKHFRWPSALRDLPRLRRIMAERDVTAVHCHMPNAHLLAALARPRPGPILVRSCYAPEGPKAGLRTALLFRHATDGVAVISARAREAVLRRVGGDPDAVAVIEPGIDLDRFARPGPREAARARFGLRPDHFVVGMVTRIRRARRIDVALAAFAGLAADFADARWLLVGRGRAAAVEEEVNRPVREAGLADRVVAPGYCRDDALVSAFGAMDLLLYPVPGTDGSCRTVREAMACGVPVIASPAGFLPELIRDGVTGRLVYLSAAAWAAELVRCRRNRDALQAMGRAAREEAQRRFSLELQARRTLTFYEMRLSQPRRSDEDARR